jgi:hypothetical protein
LAAQFSAGLVQSKILTAHPWARLRVYAVCVNKQVGRPQPLGYRRADRTDPRMVHLWDANDVSGAWLIGKFPGLPGSDWDTYLQRRCTAITGWLGRDGRQSQCQPVGPQLAGSVHLLTYTG